MKKREPLSIWQTRTFSLPRYDFTSKPTETKYEQVEVSESEMLNIFKGLRPRNMDYADFVIIRRMIQKEVARYLKGELVHVSKVSDEMWADYTKGMVNKPKQKGVTYVKKDDSGNADTEQ